MDDQSQDPQLLGSWIADPEPSEKVTLEFRPDGLLVYTIYGHEKHEVILLRFATRNGLIITDQASLPRREETKYRFVNDKLILDYDGEITVYARLPAVLS